MSFTRARPFGFWTTGSTVLASEFEHLDDYAYAVDSRGGTYSPAGVITIGGSGLSVTGPCSLSNVTAATFNCQIAGTKGLLVTQSTVNGNGGDYAGNGTGWGVGAAGGNSGGTGGVFVGGTGGKGINAIGDGAGVGALIEGGASAAGASITGGTVGAVIVGGTIGATIEGTTTGATITGGVGNNIGLIATSTGTAQAIRCDNGGIHFNGTQPVKTADPGANAAHATNQCKAWAYITTDGLGGITLEDGYNVASVNINASRIDVLYARAMASANYAVLLTAQSNSIIFHTITSGGLSTTFCTIASFSTTLSSLPAETNALKIMMMVFARQ